MQRIVYYGINYISRYISVHKELEKIAGVSELLEGNEGDGPEMTLEEVKQSLVNDKGNVGKIAMLLYRGKNTDDEVGDVALLCFALATIEGMFPAIKAVYAKITRFEAGYVTMGLAASLMWSVEEYFNNYKILEQAFKRLAPILVHNYDIDVMNISMIMDRRMMGFLSNTGSPLSLDRHLVSVEKCLPDEEIQKNEVFWNDKLKDLVTQYESLVEHSNAKDVNINPVIAISGKEKSGRHFLSRQFASYYKKDLIVFDISFITDEKNIWYSVTKLFRELFFTSGLIAISGVSQEDDVIKALNEIIKVYQGIYVENRPIIIIADEKFKPMSYLDGPIISASLTIPDMNLAEKVWHNLQEDILGEQFIDSKEVASKMKLTIGQIKGIVNRMLYNKPAVKANKNLVYRYCYETLDDGRFEGIKRVDIKESLEDLILPDSQKEVIKHICGQVTNRMKVMGQWNLREHFTYGTGVSALFVGPPGTGKTMAARVVAGMLGLELFQIDLSQVVDKYVGETEKKLEEIFNKASQSNMVLFFDEADAIIGNRSEVKEAQDKYANVEVAFLLQRLEQYDGIALFASNFLQNIDPAFRRRMRFLVRFERPTEDEREAIWRSVIPKELPVERIDFKYLKSNFDFSGAQIKNTIFNAAFLAAEEDEPMGMTHIARAALIEIKKEKISNLREALGIYADMVPELDLNEDVE